MDSTVSQTLALAIYAVLGTWFDMAHNPKRCVVMKWLLLSLVLLSRSVVAMGQDKNLHDGNHLLHACQAGLTATAQAPPENPFDSGYCILLSTT